MSTEALSSTDVAMPAHALRALRILLADDNRDLVLSLQLLLQDDGHDVTGVHNGLDALRVARLHAFDVMILDIEMPELSGYALARELLAQAVGFDHHLSKPCDPTALLKLVSAHRLAILGAR